MGLNFTGRQINNSYSNVRDTLRISGNDPFGRVQVATDTNILSLLSMYGPSYLRDRIVGFDVSGSAAGTAEVTTTLGYYEIRSGGTAGSNICLRSAIRGRYIPGKAAEAGIGIYIPTTVTGDGKMRWGLGDGDNGAYFELTSAGLSVKVIQSDVTVADVAQADWNLDVVDGSNSARNPSGQALDINTGGHLFGVRFTWYGFGKIDFIIWHPDNTTNREILETVVHEYIPEAGQSFTDPNLPVFAELTNGTSTQDLKMFIGGRRYDIIGEFSPERKITGAYRISQTVSGTGFTPLIAFRKATTFKGRKNSVPAYVDGFDILSSGNLVVGIFGNGSVQGGSYVTPEFCVSAGETALEVNTSCSAMTSTVRINGPFIILGGGVGLNKQDIGSTKTLRVDLIGQDNLILAARPVSAVDVSITCTMRMVEEW